MITEEQKQEADRIVEVGQIVNVGIELKGRQWESPQGETRYFNTIEAWRILPSTSDKKPETTVNNITDSSLHEESPF